MAGSPTTAPDAFTPDGEITGASGNGPLPGLRVAPVCHSCGKIAPPSACTASATLRQPARDRSPKNLGTRLLPPEPSST